MLDIFISYLKSFLSLRFLKRPHRCFRLHYFHHLYFHHQSPVTTASSTIIITAASAASTIIARTPS
jgi:hypothetical protein